MTFLFAIVKLADTNFKIYVTNHVWYDYYQLYLCAEYQFKNKEGNRPKIILIIKGTFKYDLDHSRACESSIHLFLGIKQFL